MHSAMIPKSHSLRLHPFSMKLLISWALRIVRQSCFGSSSNATSVPSAKSWASPKTLYLKANRRNAASLLAAYRTSGDAALLAEAMRKFRSEERRVGKEWKGGGARYD